MGKIRRRSGPLGAGGHRPSMHFHLPRPRFPKGLSPGFLIFSFLAVCPGLYFREHYFIVLLPAFAFSSGKAVTLGERWLERTREGAQARYLPIASTSLACAHSLYAKREVFFSRRRSRPAANLRKQSLSRVARDRGTSKTIPRRMRRSRCWVRSRRFTSMRTAIPRPDIFTLIR